MAAEELGLAGDAEGGALLGVLSSGDKLAHRAPDTRIPAHPRQSWGSCSSRRALKANSSRPTVRPGRGSYRVPAFATTARRVTGPWSSLEATLRPAMVVGSYDAFSDAAAANPRCTVFAAPARRRACWLPLDRADREIMVGGGWCRRLTVVVRVGGSSAWRSCSLSDSENSLAWRWIRPPGARESSQLRWRKNLSAGLGLLRVG